MNLIFEGLYKSYHDKMVLSNISGGISNGEKIGWQAPKKVPIIKMPPERKPAP